MKKLFVVLYLFTAYAAIVSAQARFTSNTENYDFGQIEWKQPVTAQYIITNTGDKPLVLTHVEPDCACTMANWTQTPIAPGATGTINVTFDAEALGRFRKSVAIMTNAQPVVYLYFSGQVVREIKDFTKTHPYQIGDLRVDKNELNFPDVQHGEQSVLRVGVVNLSKQPYEPVLMHLPSYLEMNVNPSVLQPGEKGSITLTLNSEKLGDWGLTQTSVYLSRFSGDKVGEENEIPISVVLLPDLTNMTTSEKSNAPIIALSMKEIDMATTLLKKSKAKQDIIITNKGHSTLHISKLQVFHPAVGVSLKKNMLQPGESTRLRVTVQKKNIGNKHHKLRLLMITNDPVQPKVEINIKAK